MKPNFILTFSLVLAVLLFSIGVAHADTATTEYLYTTYYDTGALSVIDTGTNTQLNTAPISVKARDIISSPNGDKLYAVTGSDNRLVYINPISNSITTTIALPYPSGIAISNDNTNLYVSLYDANLVTIIDIDTGAIITNISVGAHPTYPMLSKDGNTLYVVCEDSNYVYVINTVTKTVSGTMSLDTNLPHKIVLNNDNTLLYAISHNNDFAHNGSIYVFYTGNNTKKTSFTTDIYPYAIDIDAYGNYYVGFVPTDSVNPRYYIKYDNTNTLNTRVSVSYDSANTYDYPVDIKISGNGILYVAHGSTISAYDRMNNTLLKTIYTSKGNAERMTVIVPYITEVSQQLVKFTVASSFGLVKYADVPVSVYHANGVQVYSHNTGNDGCVPFVLSPNVLYTISAIDLDRNINKTITLYPTNTAYMLDVGISPIINFNGLWHSADINQSYSFDSGTGDPLQDVTLTVSQSPRNIPTSRSIMAVYSDDTSSTGTVNFTLYKVVNNNSIYVDSEIVALSKAGNLLDNNGFENGVITGADWAWGASGSGNIFNITDSRAHTGEYSAVMQVTSNNGSISLVSAKYPANANTMYHFAFYNISNANGNEANIQFFDSGDTYLGSGTNSYTINENLDWQCSDFYSVSPQNTATARVIITTNKIGRVFIDDTSLTSNSAVAVFNIANDTQTKDSSTYKIVVTSDTDAYGTVQRIAYNSWDGTGYLLPGLGLDNKALPYEWICFGIIFLIIIIGTFMSNGIIIFIAGAAWEIMIAIGWMASSTQNFALGALVMAIGVGYVLMQKRREVV